MKLIDKKISGLIIFFMLILILAIALMGNGNVADAQSTNTTLLNHVNGLTIEQVISQNFSNANIVDCAFGEYGYCRSAIC